MGRLSKNYWDWDLPMLIKYGFPLDFDRKATIITDKINHKSATEYPSHVNTYLAEEIEYGTMGVRILNHIYMSASSLNMGRWGVSILNHIYMLAPS